MWWNSEPLRLNHSKSEGVGGEVLSLWDLEIDQKIKVDKEHYILI